VSAAASLLSELVTCGDGEDLVSACHGDGVVMMGAPPRGGGSVVVSEQGEAGDRLMPERVGMGACQPHRFDGDGVGQSHGLLCVVSITTRPDDLTGADLGCHGEDHRSRG